MLLSIGYDPIASTAFSSSTVFFSSLATSTQFIIAGGIHFAHAWLFGLLSFGGALTGYFILSAVLRRYKRPSIIIWVILAVMTISGIVLPLELFLTIKKDKILEFGGIC